MSPPSPSAHGESATSPTGEALVRLLREELIKTQLMVLELNDRIIASKTEKADAVAVLGQIELLVEAQTNELLEAEIRFGTRISALESKLKLAEEEIRLRDATIQTQSTHINTTDREASELKLREEMSTRRLAEASTSLVEVGIRFEESRQALAQSERLLKEERSRLNRIFASVFWRLGRPWRLFFGPKI